MSSVSLPPIYETLTYAPMSKLKNPADPLFDCELPVWNDTDLSAPCDYRPYFEMTLTDIVEKPDGYDRILPKLVSWHCHSSQVSNQKKPRRALLNSGFILAPKMLWDKKDSKKKKDSISTAPSRQVIHADESERNFYLIFSKRG